MKLDIRTAKKHEAVNFACELDLSALERWGSSPFPEPVQVAGRAVDNGDYYEISYTAKLFLHMLCARCLKPLRDEKELSFLHSLTEPGEDTSPGDEDIPLADGILDLSVMVAEDVFLATDETALCSPDCKGLCLVCGGDKNTSPCGCDITPPDPRFDALRGLLDKRQEENRKTED